MDTTKSIIIYTAIALMTTSALASCDKAGLSAGNSDMIKFGANTVIINGDTKSGPITDGTLPDGTSFGVMGYCLSQAGPDNPTLNNTSGNIPWQQKKTLCTPTIFYDNEVTYIDGTFMYSPMKTWYEQPDFLYSFFAYYPKENFTVLSALDDFGAPSVKFSIPFDGTTANDTTKVLDYDKVPDAMAAQEIDITKGSGIVTLNFMHLMSGLNFQVNNYNAAEDENGNLAAGKPVTIHSLKLRGKFYKSVNIYFDNRYDYPDEVFYGTYELLGDSDDDDVTVEALTSYERIGDKTLLLVSNLNKTGIEDGYLGDLKLVIEYTFGEPGNTGRKIQYISRPDNFQPSGGTIYTAQLNFIGDAFVLNFIVDNDSRWEDGGDSEITFG